MSANAKPRCALTGASGYLGGIIARKLKASGWDVAPLSRRPGAGEIHFALGEPIAADALVGCDALIHCAYDFGQIEWRDIERVNVKGSALLFRAAAEVRIPHMLHISTISAFDGCTSLYGRAKLLIEAEVQRLGACVIRPGLIYGPSPGAMFGRLVRQVRVSRFVPMPGDGRQAQYMVHEDDLAEAILRGLTKEPAPRAPVTVANAAPIAFRDIILFIGARLAKRVTPIPTPWRLMWLGIRAAELMRIPLGLRSDSLISLVHQNVAPHFNAESELGVRCRPFDLSAVEL
jgi:nucleoside-diphosphate-sugar epimerase